MISEKTHNWIQTIAAISVLMGLVLVFLELRQNRDFARLQIGVGSFDNTYQKYLTIMGENYADVDIKACLSPEELTQEEVVQHWAYLGTLWTENGKSLRLQSIGGVNRPIESIVKGNLRVYLGYPLGMFDYEEFGKRDWDEFLRDIAADLISNDEIFHCEDLYQPILDKFLNN